MSDFYSFARAHGVVLPNHLDEGDTIRRCATTEHPRSKNGAYRWDGKRGWVMAWDGDGGVHWFGNDRAPIERTEAEKQAWRRRREAEERKQFARRTNAVQTARQMLAQATPKEHGYLQRKGFPAALGLVLPDEALFVPMRDLMTNELCGGQVIRWELDEEKGAWNWNKKMLFGMRAQGAVLRLGWPKATECVLVEGYATGLSVELAVRQMRLNASVLVTFNTANLKLVAERTTGRRYVIADNDPIQTDPVKFKLNPGEQGQRAAAATGLGWAMSKTAGFDANDEHTKRGLMAVCSLVQQARSAQPVNPWAKVLAVA